MTFRWPGGADMVVDVHLTGFVGETVHHPTRLTFDGQGTHTATVSLPRDGVVSYGFRVGPAPELPSVPLPELVDHLVADPSNADGIRGAFGSRGSTSVLELPDARRHRAWPSAADRRGPVPVASVPRPVAIPGRRMGWLDGDGPTVVVFDGDIWARDDFGFTRAWHRHTAHRSRPALALVSTPDREILDDRDRLRRLLYDEVMPQLPNASAEVVVAGQSFGGLAAAGLLVDLPDVVRAAVVQSGSFWFGADDPGDPGPAGLGTVVSDLARRAGASGQRVVVQAGSTEGSMLAQSRGFAAACVEAGLETSMEVFTGGHDYAWYRHGLLLALDQLGLPDHRGEVAARNRTTEASPDAARR